MIELDDVHKRLGDRDILKGLTLRIPKGVNFVLMGPSGTGKSVTLKHVIGIFKPDQGQVRVDGQDVPAMDRDALMGLRRRMGYLFQNGALINWLSVAENVALPLKEHGRLTRSEVEERVHQALQHVGMDHAAKQHPPDISGGMKLRAGLARALGERQQLFASTGGSHGALLATADGDVVACGEDVGRHNALDKAIGAAAAAGAPLAECVAVLSGRAGFDLVVKCLRTRVAVIVSVSAPSALAFDLCAAAGATLVGFARGDSHRVYCGAERLVSDAS